MKLSQDTLARHAQRTRYPEHTLAPDPRQPELKLRPMRADNCTRCKGLHFTAADAEHCRQANMQREQF